MRFRAEHSMRPLLFSALAAAAVGFLAVLPTAAAQDDGCTQTNPCLLDIEVDETGISSVSVTTLSSGDWYYLSVSNLDSSSHTVSIEGHDAALQVEGDFFADSQAFQIGGAGTYDLRDQPTGDTAALTVVEGDALGGSDGSSSDGAGSGLGIPGLPMPLVIAALAASALVVGRRR